MIRHDRLEAIMAALHGLRRSHAHLLRSLAARLDGLPAQDVLCLPLLLHGGMTPGQIMQETGLTTGAVTSLVDRLEHAGLAVRRPVPDDRRSVLVTLAPDAHPRVFALLGQAHETAQTLFEGWTTEDLHTFAALLQRFSRQPDAAQPEAVGDDAHAAETHGGRSDHGG